MPTRVLGLATDHMPLLSLRCKMGYVRMRTRRTHILPASTLTLSRRERAQRGASLYAELGRQIVKIDGMDGKGRVRSQVWRTLGAMFHGAWDKRRL